MTYDEALKKRNDARERRRSLKKNDETPLCILDAEYNWGYWDAVITIMKDCGIKELDPKVVL